MSIMIGAFISCYSRKYWQKKSLEQVDFATHILAKFEIDNGFLSFAETKFDNNKPKEPHTNKDLQEMHDVIEIRRLNLSSTPENRLTVLVGESGIGKSTSVCKYAKILRQQGSPVYYFCMNKRDKKSMTISSFLMDLFGTDNLQQIYDVIENNYTSKGKTATLIIDNIHFCQNKGVFCSSILTTLNNTFFQRLKMNVIMSSSVNDYAYRMNYGIHFTYFYDFSQHYLINKNQDLMVG